MTIRESQPETQQRAVGVFQRNQGVLRTMQAIRLGVHPRTLYAMRENGTLEQISRGLFRLADLPPLGSPDLLTVAKLVPSGVLCLVSALSLHGLTTEIPHEVYVALPRGAETPRIEHPPIRVFRFGGAAHDGGVEFHEVDGCEIGVYGAAKSIADCFKFRNRLGIEVPIEGLKRYLALPSSSVDELLRFARICRVESVMRPYLEALL